MILVISGPSGSGKSTIVKMMIQNNPQKYERIKSFTTRKSRKGKAASDDCYYFVTEKEFEIMDQSSNFLETNKYQGNSARYGTPKVPVFQALQEKKTPILEIDVNGKKKIEKYFQKNVEIVSIFIVASPRTIFNRLLSRGESPEEAVKRLKASLNEVRQSAFYDLVVTNNDLEHTLEVINHVLFNGVKNSGSVFALNEYIEELQDLIREVSI